MEDFIIKYKMTGPVEIDVDIVVKKWNFLWWISQYGEEYRLIKNLRRGTASTSVKFTISKLQQL